MVFRKKSNNFANRMTKKEDLVRKGARVAEEARLESV